jgi:capsular polysaccharide transport system permease protein
MERDNEQRSAREMAKEIERPAARVNFAVMLAASSAQIARRMFQLRPISTVVPLEEETHRPGRVPFSRSSRYLLSLILFVAIPSIVSVVYLAFIASDQYVAEARFAVKATQFELDRDKLKSAMSSMGSGSIPSLSGQEAYIIANYVHSRAIIDELSKKLDLRQIFTRPEADFWARLKENANIEKLVEYWDGMVRTYVDGPSGIVTIEARAFRPDDALTLSRAIVEASEKLSNEISARARNDAMKRAEDEVRRSEGMVETALADMRKYRDTEGYIDPLASATSTSQLLQQTMAEEIRLQSDYFVAAKAMSPDAPTVATLKTRIASLDGQISQLKSKLTGNSADASTISASLVKFETLELQRRFAEKLYELAQDGLERARLKAEQQNVYVNVFVPPALPEEAKYPERFSLAVLIPIGLLIVWGIFALMAAAVEDHRY